MSWLLFVDESGHDHKTMPYEVRGGIALHASELWPFVQGMQRLELESFGCQLHQYRKELKGSTLLDAKRFRLAAQAEALEPDARRKHSRGFLNAGLESRSPKRDEFTAYGQACLEMARGIFQLLRDHQAILFAGAIPRSVKKPATYAADQFLRKDHVFLFERFYYFLEAEQEHGLIVMDEAEKHLDRKFVRKVETYFSKTERGRFWSGWIVPTPLFVSSDMALPVQAADVCIYCVNWGFRIPAQGMDSAVRLEIAEEFGRWLNLLQFAGQGHREGTVFDSFGIFYVPNPYSPGRA